MKQRIIAIHLVYVKDSEALAIHPKRLRKDRMDRKNPTWNFMGFSHQDKDRREL
jgi:hypothetical protein